MEDTYNGNAHDMEKMSNEIDEAFDRAIQKRIHELRRTNHVYHEDAGHGWLKIDLSDLKILEIDDKISEYSFAYAGKVYLEEDQDAIIYLKTLWPMGLGTEVFKQFQQLYVSSINDGDESNIRSLPRYRYKK